MKNLLVLTFLSLIISCINPKKDSKITASNSVSVVNDVYSARFKNLQRLDSISSFISQKNNVDIILLQANKCNVCNSAKLSKINSSLSELTNPYIIIIGSLDSSIKEVADYLPNALKSTYYYTTDVERLGLSLMENYLINFRQGEYLSYEILE